MQSSYLGIKEVGRIRWFVVVRPHPPFRGNHLAADQQVGESDALVLMQERICQTREMEATEPTQWVGDIISNGGRDYLGNHSKWLQLFGFSTLSQ
jgi:hypothetical protein